MMREKMKDLILRTRDNKEENEYTLRGVLETYIVKSIDKEGNTIYTVKIGRDLTVQRKGVWSTLMKMEYFADCIMGNTNNNALHYMDLESAMKHAEKMGAFEFAKHIKKFIELGYTHAHIDGGNRTDSIIDTLTNEIPIMAGIYDYGHDEEGNHIYFRLEKDTFFEDLEEDFKNAILDYSSLKVWVYYDLTRAKRKTLFRKLNDGVDLNAPEIRNCEESEVCDINRKHDLKYDNLYIDTKVLTEDATSRWKLSEYIAKLKSARRTLSYDEKGKLVVIWPSSIDVDKEYLTGSDADRLAIEEEKWFVNNFISYLKILEEDESALFERNLYVDFFLLISYLKKKNIDLTYPVTKEKKLAFIKLFNEKHAIEWNAETNKPWISKYTKKKPVKVEWSGLYSKNNDLVIIQRLNRWVDEFVSEMLDKKILVKITERTPTNKHETSVLLKKQNSITKISGAVVNTLKIAKDPTYANIDHIKDLRGGGEDTIKNKSIELGKDNKEKGAARV